MSKFWSNIADDEDDISSVEQDETNSSEDVFRTPERQIRKNDNLSLDPDLAWAQIKDTQVFLNLTRRADSAKVTGVKDESYTRVVCMSDTHGKHREISVPKGDILIHGGDFTKTGETGTVQDLAQYFHELQMDGSFQEVVCIAGNHELTFQKDFYAQNGSRFHKKKLFDANATKQSLQNCIYLEDESYFNDKCGVEIYGSPWQPEFCGWAFNLPRGQPLREVWSRVPSSTEILVTHGPPLGRGDLCSHGCRVGCYDLLCEVQERIKPRLHIFGHVHEGYGVSHDGQTLFVNASNLTCQYQANNPCIVIDLPHDKTIPAMIVEPNCPLIDSDSFLSWLNRSGYESLAGVARKSLKLKELPVGNDLLRDSAYYDICNMLHWHKEVKQELRRALSQIYAESF